MASSLVFKVRRKQPELVAPAKATPHEFKPLSDIDDQKGLRFQVPIIHFYRSEASPAMAGRDPAQVVRKALAEALVFYYPLAGRLREWPGNKLVVECTGEGVMFIEADADVRLEQFGDPLQPPFPCFDELLYSVPGSGDILNCPLILIQVTRLTCGGFVFALRLNHTMSDATGLIQFLTAVAELARGAPSPSIAPVWDRHLLHARSSPRVTCIHREYEELPDQIGMAHVAAPNDRAHHTFFFSQVHIAALRSHLPRHLHASATTIDLLAACLWRCRTVALDLDPSEEVKICCVVNMRGHGRLRPPLPAGYYGNAIIHPAAVSKAGNLCRHPLGYAVELVRRAKSEATDEYVRSVADFMVLKGRPDFGLVRNIVVSDLTRAGNRDVDFGWGPAVYGGIGIGVGSIFRLGIFLTPSRNGNGEDGILLPIALPGPAMKRFRVEVERLILGTTEGAGPTCSSKLILPRL